MIIAQPSVAQADEDLSQLSADGERAALLINQLRADAGLAPLRVHPLLTLAANLHIQDMTSTGVYGHYGSDGASVHQRIARVGYTTNGWNGENWAVSETVDKSVGWWMTDAPHRENVLNRSYTEMGIGVAPHPLGWGLILVVDFSTGSAGGVGGYVPGDGQVAAPSEIFTAQAIAAVPVADSGVRYRAVAGDTLFSIGLRYGVDWQSMAQLNGLGEHTVLSIGTELRIPATGASAENTGAAETRQLSRQYTVASGDTLLGIALRFDIQWQALAAANGLGESSLLQIGEQLTIPGATETPGIETPVQAAPPVIRTHTVQSGETIWVIAARRGVDWRALLRVNGMSEQSYLQIGQVLTLP